MLLVNFPAPSVAAVKKIFESNCFLKFSCGRLIMDLILLCIFQFEGELYLLATDQGYINEPDLVWEKLNEVKVLFRNVCAY